MSDNLDSGGLITGSTFNRATNKIYLIGYNILLQPFIWVIEDFDKENIFSGNTDQIYLASLGPEQAEAITHIGANRYFIASESFRIASFSDDAQLISFISLDPVLSSTEEKSLNMTLYPIPSEGALHLELEESQHAHILDEKGRRIQQVELNSGRNNIDLSQLSPGMYYLYLENGEVLSFIKSR
jgi:hypothetical protein